MGLSHSYVFGFFCLMMLLHLIWGDDGARNQRYFIRKITTEVAISTLQTNHENQYSQQKIREI